MLLSLFSLGACGSSSTAPGASGASGASASSGGNGNGGAQGDRGGTAGLSSAAGAAGGSAGSGVCQHELTNAACWQSREVNRFTANEQSFFGAVFDGRYVLFVDGTTSTNDVQLRFDSQADFTSNSGWSTFNTVGTIGSGFEGGAFDGRYVYLTPTNPEFNGAAAQTYDAVVGRFDTQAPFDSNSSWSAFNLTQASGTPDLTVPGFGGAAFDGRYVYFAPSSVGKLTGGNTPSGKVTRYDTQADFSKAASWATFELSAVSPNAAGFSGAIFDGRYLYFAPSATRNALAARYDTQADFSTSGSWATFETTSVNQYAGGFQGGVFDGRYVYFVPRSGYNAYHAVVTRYDTDGGFTAAASWSTFDTTALNGSGFSQWVFEGGAFDGHYVYFVPSQGGPLVRFDTQGDFGSTDAWGTVQLFQVAPGADGFSGAAFDGRYLYLVPNNLLSAVRFDAGASAALPAASHGSFY